MRVAGSRVSLAAVLFAAGALAASGEVVSPRRVEGLLINGGGRAAINYQSHLLHVRQLVEVLRHRGVPDRRITVLSGDGADPAADLALREVVPGPGAMERADQPDGFITAIRRLPASEAQYEEFPAGIDPRLRAALSRRGIDRLYTHQARAIEHSLAGRNVVVTMDYEFVFERFRTATAGQQPCFIGNGWRGLA